MIDLDHYSIHRAPVIAFYCKNKHLELKEIISAYAVYNHCPCIVVCFYISEQFGFSEQLVKAIDSLIKFYDYKIILGQKPESIYLTLDPFSVRV